MGKNDKNKKYRKSMDEMVAMIQDYILKHPTPEGVVPDISSEQYKLGYKRALEDFLFIIA